MIFWEHLIFPTRKRPHKACFTKIIYLAVQINLDKKLQRDSHPNKKRALSSSLKLGGGGILLLVRTKRHFLSKAQRLRHFCLCSLALSCSFALNDISCRRLNASATSASAHSRSNLKQNFVLLGSHPNKKRALSSSLKLGGGGIRTHGTLARTTVFKTAPINRSGTPPKRSSILIKKYSVVKSLFFSC